MTQRDEDRHTSTPEEDAALSSAALARGDLPHAAQHIAAALSGDPLRPEWRATLDRILELTPDPLLLFRPPAEEPVFFGTVAAHAYALARCNAYQEALDLLLQVAAVRPDVPYLGWAAEWLESPAAVAALDPERVSLYLARWLRRYAGNDELGEEELAGLEHLAPVLERILAVHDRTFGLLVLSASALRRVGRHERALTCALRAYDLEPGWHTATSVALVHREAGVVDSAVEWYLRALQHDPSDLSARLDLGDMLGEGRRLDEALRWYEEVLEQEPSHPWAQPSLCYVRWLQSGEDRWLQRIVAMAGADPPNRRAQVLLGRLVAQGRPWVGHIPEPRDATIAFLREAGERLAEGRRIEMSVSTLEAPSTRLAFARYAAERGLDVSLEVRVGQVQEPDPRRPTAPVEYLLWEYDGTDPRPAVDPPQDPQVTRELARLAASSFDLGAWARRGRGLAVRLGRAALSDILGAMLHPPEAPSGFTPWMWIRRVQVAAACVVAYVDEGWFGSLRRQVLLSLLHGPMDWSVEAAAVVLAHLARGSREIENEVLEALLELAMAVPRPGFCCYESTLLQLLLDMPGLPADLRAPLEAQLEGLVGDQEQGER